MLEAVEIRAAAEAGLPAGERTVSALRRDHPRPGAGRTARGRPTGARAARRAEPAIIVSGMEKGARQDVVELLAGVPLFSELSPEELQRVAQVAIPRRYPGDTRVFHEGDPGDACYIVQHGSCRVIRQHSDGRVITLATLGPGAIFGELAMLDGERRSASIEAVEDTELLALPATDMRALIREQSRDGREAGRGADPPPARGERANRPAVLSDRSEPSRRRPQSAARRGGGHPAGTRRRDDQAAAVRSRPDGRDLPRERQPVPRDARAGRSGPGRQGPGDGDSSPSASTPTSSRPTWPPGSSIARARRLDRMRGAAAMLRAARRRGIDDQRVLAAMAAVPREHFVPDRVRDERLQRLGASDRTRSDHLAALGGRRDLPGPPAGRPTRTCSRSAPAPATRRPFWRTWRAQVISIERVPELGEAARSQARGPRHRERRGDRRRRQPRVPRGRAVRRDRGPRRNPRGAAQPARGARARTAAWSSRSRPARRTC